MSAQRTRPVVPADHRSAHPDISGLPWWGAVAVALICCALGFAFDAGSGGGNLTKVFGSLYAIGCLAAVLSVRRSGLFTAVVQPPLILFAVVPGAYFLMHSSNIHGLKDLLINCGYPLIERFPLMFFTTAAVLLIGGARWYLGRSDASEDTAGQDDATPRPGVLATLTAMINSRLESRAEASAPRRRRADDGRRAAKPARAGSDRPTRRASSSTKRSRPTRPPEADPADPTRERRRRRPQPTDPPAAERPRRRTRPAGERARRGDVPPRDRERRRSDREYRDRRDGTDRDRQRRTPRPRPPRNDSFDGYELFGGYEPAPRSRPRPDGDHHPVSRVRYRSSDDGGDRPPRRRPAQDRDADRWNYDI